MIASLRSNFSARIRPGTEPEDAVDALMARVRAVVVKAVEGSAGGDVTITIDSLRVYYTPAWVTEQEQGGDGTQVL